MARRGWAVTLFERGERLLPGASRNNEGKVHLGYTYGLDGSGRTRELMARHGLSFEPLLSEILGEAVSGTIVSRRQHYAVHRDTSLDLDGVAAHMAAVAGLIGDPQAVRLLPNAEVRRTYGDDIIAAYDVRESSVECDELCTLVADAVAATPGIRVETGVSVSAVDDDGAVRGADGAVLGRFSRVVNAAWDGMPAIERRAGHMTHPLVLRGKAGFLTRLESGSIDQAVTIVYGAFGDVVPLRNGTMYLSWYPESRMGLTTDLSAGSAWYERTAAAFDFAAAYSRSVEVLETLMPGVVFAETPMSIRSGPILAAGETDINDPLSGLHRRTQIGIYKRGSVLAIDTGKFTSAPVLAAQVADALAG
jgi:hypothetical protein